MDQFHLDIAVGQITDGNGKFDSCFLYCVVSNSFNNSFKNISSSVEIPLSSIVFKCLNTVSVRKSAEELNYYKLKKNAF